MVAALSAFPIKSFDQRDPCGWDEEAVEGREEPMRASYEEAAEEQSASHTDEEDEVEPAAAKSVPEEDEDEDASERLRRAVCRAQRAMRLDLEADAAGWDAKARSFLRERGFDDGAASPRPVLLSRVSKSTSKAAGEGALAGAPPRDGGAARGSGCKAGFEVSQCDAKSGPRCHMKGALGGM
eukprot:CAMPEP_0179097056 /NCGR_PEP_ID=MMETSP0796-20121207/44649_1 /TAXON_ID=73915 /ORGANISM="Pyrodinium bahamense, Strain pbaha01" /LENGTH=181 /DNA_ID=CAMNT_0020794787 /DNA_START=50 /DNA_END=595 /DNA_ORIENTATION=-